MQVPEDREEDDLPLASRGSVKVFGLISVGVKPPHGSTCGAGWEKEIRNDKRELRARHEEERGLKCGVVAIAS